MLQIERKSLRVFGVYAKNSGGFLSILDTIETTGGKSCSFRQFYLDKLTEEIKENYFLKGKKKALAIIELDFYARAFKIQI